jgi:hypothetical protein
LKRRKIVGKRSLKTRKRRKKSLRRLKDLIETLLKMALFGHDDNVRRLSSNLSTGQNFDEDVVGPDGELELSGGNLFFTFNENLLLFFKSHFQ